MNASIDLSALKGLHIPIEPDIFPLSIGWWLVIIVFLLFLFFLSFLFLLWYHSLSRQVWREYNEIKKMKNNTLVLKQVNQLAKKVAISRFGRDKIAHLDTADWISFMNSLLKNELFSKEFLDLLNKSIYARNYHVSDEMRIHILENYKIWLKAALKK